MVDHVFLFHPHSGSDPLPQAYGKKDKRVYSLLVQVRVSLARRRATATV